VHPGNARVYARLGRLLEGEECTLAQLEVFPDEELKWVAWERCRSLRWRAHTHTPLLLTLLLLLLLPAPDADVHAHTAAAPNFSAVAAHAVAAAACTWGWRARTHYCCQCLYCWRRLPPLLPACLHDAACLPACPPCLLLHRVVDAGLVDSSDLSFLGSGAAAAAAARTGRRAAETGFKNTALTGGGGGGGGAGGSEWAQASKRVQQRGAPRARCLCLAGAM
jgi:hypothetical protein